MARIAVGGIQHETNTFADSPATLAQFFEADAWHRRGTHASPHHCAIAVVLGAALRVARNSGPVLLADTQDNPGASGDADTTGLLKACIAARLPGMARWRCSNSKARAECCC